MGLIKLGIFLFGIHYITKSIREDRRCGAGRNHHEDPSNNSLPNPNSKPPGSPHTFQQYPASSQYQPQNTTYRDEKHVYSEPPRMIGDTQQIQMREAPTYEDATSNRLVVAEHDCPNCGMHLQEKMIKN